MTSVIEIVVRCPSCLEPNQHGELASLGSWYLKHWTDGWRDPIPPPGTLFRCGGCEYVAFRDEFSDLGRLVRPVRLCDVEVIEVGPNRVRVMQALRAALDLDLSGVKRLVDEVPIRAAVDLYINEAHDLMNALRDAGASCMLHTRNLGDSSPASWFDAPRLSTAREVETLRGHVESSNLDPARELDLRVELYWAWNHPFRDGLRSWIPVNQRGAEERENAKRLFSLLRDDDAGPRLTKTNLARESADFAAAEHLLTSKAFGDLDPLAAYLLRLTRGRESALLPFGPDALEPAQSTAAPRE